MTIDCTTTVLTYGQLCAMHDAEIVRLRRELMASTQPHTFATARNIGQLGIEAATRGF